MVQWLRVVLRKAPQFMVDAPNFIGVPVTTALLCYLKTQSGRAFFETATVNKELRRVVRAWSQFLSSPESLTEINNGTFGWMSPCALTIVNMTEFQYDADAPHWGFSSWSTFFTRPLRAGVRPVGGGGALDVLVAPGDTEVELIHFDVKVGPEGGELCSVV